MITSQASTARNPVAGPPIALAEIERATVTSLTSDGYLESCVIFGLVMILLATAGLTYDAIRKRKEFERIVEMKEMEFVLLMNIR